MRLLIVSVVVLVGGCGGTVGSSGSPDGAVAVHGGDSSIVDTLGSADAVPAADTASLGQTLESGDATSLPNEAGPGVDADPCTVVLASSYDQTCVVDTDCASVGQISSCPRRGYDWCERWQVNRRVLTQYTAALQRAVGVPFDGGVSSGCVDLSPCCRGGMCTSSCVSPEDALPACADAGGSCGGPFPNPNGRCALGSKQGPLDACAYSDEVCCIFSAN
jgi:hypothetical protein